MSFDLEEFQEALEQSGTEWRISGQSLAAKDCPACGSSKYKVIFRINRDDDDVFLGKCMRGACGEGFSSIKYLIMQGMDRDKVLALHGRDAASNLRNLSEIDEQEPKAKKHVIQDQSDVDITGFVDIESLPDHYVAKYAKKRGYTKEHNHLIKMDLSDNSVVFLVRDGLSVTGYQKRFVSPLANPKTKTSSGFKRDVLLSFYRPDPAPVAVCEGPFTALSAWHFDLMGVCTFGSSISKGQMEAIISYGHQGREVLYALETDDEASGVALRKFRAAMAWADIPFQIIKPLVGKDLNDAWQATSGYTVEDPGADNIWLPRIDKLF